MTFAFGRRRRGVLRVGHWARLRVVVSGRHPCLAIGGRYEQRRGARRGEFANRRRHVGSRGEGSDKLLDLPLASARGLLQELRVVLRRQVLAQDRDCGQRDPPRSEAIDHRWKAGGHTSRGDAVVRLLLGKPEARDAEPEDRRISFVRVNVLPLVQYDEQSDQIGGGLAPLGGKARDGGHEVAVGHLRERKCTVGHTLNIGGRFATPEDGACSPNARRDDVWPASHAARVVPTNVVGDAGILSAARESGGRRAPNLSSSARELFFALRKGRGAPRKSPLAGAAFTGEATLRRWGPPP